MLLSWFRLALVAALAALLASPVHAERPKLKLDGKKAKQQKQDKQQGPQQSGGTQRLRLSAWADQPIDAMYLSNPSFQKKDVADDPAKRARLAKGLEGGKGILDDISMIATIGLAGDGGVGWDTAFLPGAPKLRNRYCKDLIDVAHGLGIQVLAGYAIGDTGFAKGKKGQEFVKFLDKADDAALDRHAKAMVKFLDDEKLEFDGISFDFEINGMTEKHAPKMARLYGTLAKLLAPKGRLVAVATGIGVGKEGGKYVAKPGAGPGGSRAQPFWIGKGHPNILIRPMAYDAGIDDPALREWHESQIKYALTTAGLKPNQFQLGIKNFKNVNGTATSTMPDASKVAARGREVLRPNKVGLVIFAMGKSTNWSSYKKYDEGLNAGAPAAGTKAGQPLQGPVTSAQLAKLGK